MLANLKKTFSFRSSRWPPHRMPISVGFRPISKTLRPLAKIALTGLALIVMVIAILVALSWFMDIGNDGLAIVTNRSGLTVVAGAIHAVHNYPLSSMKAGETRKFTFHPVGSGSYRAVVQLSSGELFQNEGPYNDPGLGSYSAEEPDQEDVIVINRAGLEHLEPGGDHSAQDLESLRSAGYEPDQRVADPTRDVEAIVRIGRTATARRAWRIALVEPGRPLPSGRTVFEATDVDGLDMHWLSDRRLSIAAAKAHVLRARSVATLSGKHIDVDIKVAHHR